MQCIESNDQPIAVADPAEHIHTAQDALDMMATAQYQYNSSALVLCRENLPEAFYDLKTGLAGEILQKFSNYGMRLAIVGDFSRYPSKALRDFIVECNRGTQVFWVASQADALQAIVLAR